MPTITAMLCRIWGCGSGERKAISPESDGAANSPASVGQSDNLTEIRGIGITIQNNLHRAGIKTFAGLAASTPEEIRKILGARAKGAQVEEWILHAAKLRKAS